MIAIHQSQFLSWLPYWYKALKSDTFVVLDDVQFQKNGVQNRNQIKTPQGAHWVTMPVSVSLGDAINEIRIADLSKYSDLEKTLRGNYSRAPFFKEVYETLEVVFQKKIANLHALNDQLFYAMLQLMGVSCNVKYSSQVSPTQAKGDLVLEIIQACGEKEYVSGPGALGYMDLDKFKRAGIQVWVSKFHYVEYPQLWNRRVGFVPHLSVLDLLFNYQDRARDYIMENGNIERVV